MKCGPNPGRKSCRSLIKQCALKCTVGAVGNFPLPLTLYFVIVVYHPLAYVMIPQPCVLPGLRECAPSLI